MQLPALHDKLSALLEDPARDLYAETIFTLAADYLAAIAPCLNSPTAHLSLIGSISRMKIEGEYYDGDGNLITEAEADRLGIEPFDQTNDDAFSTLTDIIQQAREISACRTPAAEGEPELIHWHPTSSGLPDEDIMCLIHCAEGTTGEAYLDSGEWQWSGMAGMVKTPVTHYAELPIGPGESPACHAPTEEDEDPDDQAIRDLATDQHCSELIQIYPDAKLSHGDDNGCYVEAWVWADFTGTRFDKEPEDESEDDDEEEPHGLECTVCTDDSCAWCQAEKSPV